jgi:hypothetical protein
MRRLSGLQVQVLRVYRECLRAAARQPTAAAAAAMRAHVRAEFRRQVRRGGPAAPASAGRSAWPLPRARPQAAAVGRGDVQRIEHLLRKARRQLELASKAAVAVVEARAT